MSIGFWRLDANLLEVLPRDTFADPCSAARGLATFADSCGLSHWFCGGLAGYTGAASAHLKLRLGSFLLWKSPVRFVVQEDGQRFWNHNLRNYG
eukprot:5834393-Amphidinium_carterae.2